MSAKRRIRFRLVKFGFTVIILFSSALWSAQTANPDASSDAKAILNYMVSLPDRSDKRVISGQFMGYAGQISSGYQTEIVALHTKTGKWVAMVGTDFAFSDAANFQNYCALLKQYWDAGHLITISHHTPNPNTAMRDLPSNNNWRNQLDWIADRLQYLRDRGVVVLWRPFHEMNGTWFWYGAQNTDEFKALWRHMFNYFTTTKGLDNLLWVYAPDDSRTNVTGYYPGDDYVDIIGLDNYNYNAPTLDLSSYNSITSINKPFGLTEFSPKAASESSDRGDYRVLINGGLKTSFQKTCFFLCWDREWGMNYNNNATDVMNDPWIITRDDLSWKGDHADTPEVTKTIPDLRVPVNTASVNDYIDLKTIFMDRTDGTDLSYSASVVQNGSLVSVSVDGSQRLDITISQGATGIAIVEAVAANSEGKVARTTFRVVVKDYNGSENLALFECVTVSSGESENPAANAVDGQADSRWSSEYSDNQWIAIDFGRNVKVNRVILQWEAAYGAQYVIQVSSDSSNWTTVYTESNGDGGTDEIEFPATDARYIRMQGVTRGTAWGYSLYEFEVYGGGSVEAAKGYSRAVHPQVTFDRCGNGSKIRVKASGAYTVDVFAMNGSRVFRFKGTGVSEHALQGIGAGLYYTVFRTPEGLFPVRGVFVWD